MVSDKLFKSVRGNITAKNREGEKIMNDNQFKCARCNKVFTESWTEREALQEKKDNGWEDVPLNQCVRVCDDCYKQFMTQFN